MSRSTVRLSELCDLISESVRPGSRPDALYVGLEHVASGRLLPTGAGRAADMRSTTSAFQAGDVLYGKLRPYLDKAVIAQDSGVCTTELLVLRAKYCANSRFLAAALHSRRFVEHAIAGTTGVQHPRTSWVHIRDFEIPVFTPDEQRQIADILWLVHEAISKSEALVREAQSLKRAATQTLLTRGLRSETLKETEIGPVPESWEVKPFQCAISLKRGFDLPISKRKEGSVPVFGSNGIVSHHCKQPEGIPVPGVMVGRSGSIGKVSFSADAYWPLNTTLYAENFKGNVQKFMAYFLESFDFSSFGGGASVPTLNRNSFAGVKVGIPQIGEQKEIVIIIDAIDRRIKLQLRKRAVQQELFNALLHKLITGEVTVEGIRLSQDDLG